MVKKSHFTSSGAISFPGNGEYEFVFEVVNLLLKIKFKGGKVGRGKTVGLILLFCNLECFFFIGIHSMQGWTGTTKHEVTRKRNTKRLKHKGHLFRKNLQLIGVC